MMAGKLRSAERLLVRVDEQLARLRGKGGHGSQSERCEFRALGRAQRHNVIKSRTRCASFSRSLAGRGFSFSCVLSASLGEALDARE
jgi:hypothetical protein